MRYCAQHRDGSRLSARRLILFLVLLFLVLLVLGSHHALGRDVTAPGDQEVVNDEWRNVPLGNDGPTHAHNRWRFDMAWLGYDRAVMLWIKTPDGHERGTLLYRAVNARTRQLGPTFTLPVPDAVSVHAQNGPPFDLGDCLFARDSSSSADSMVETRAFRSFAAIYSNTYSPESGLEERVTLQQIDWCNGPSITTSKVISGATETALAWGRICDTPLRCRPKLLLIYGRPGKLFGLFLTAAGVPIGEEFMISSFQGILRFADVHWNAKAAKFVIWYSEKSSMMDCSHYTVNVSGKGVPEQPIRTGPCDGDVSGGHHFVSAYDADIARNPDGRFMVYRQIMDGHSIVELTTPEGANSVRVIEEHRPPIPMSARNRRDGDGYVMLTVLPDGIAGKSVSPEGAVTVRERFPGPANSGLLSIGFAAEALERYTIYVYGHCVGGKPCQRWFLSRSPY